MKGKINLPEMGWAPLYNFRSSLPSDGEVGDLAFVHTESRLLTYEIMADLYYCNGEEWRLALRDMRIPLEMVKWTHEDLGSNLEQA